MYQTCSKNGGKSDQKTLTAEGRILDVKKRIVKYLWSDFGSQNGFPNREKCRQNSASFLRSVLEDIFSRSARFWSGSGRFLEAKTGPGRDSRARRRICKNSGFTNQNYDFSRFGPSRNDPTSIKTAIEAQSWIGKQIFPVFVRFGLDFGSQNLA